MVTKSRLRMAIAAEKGVDFKKLKQAKKEKAALKRKRSGAGASQKTAADDQDLKAQGAKKEEQGEWADEDEEEDEEEESEEGEDLNLDAVDDSDTSESSIELEEKLARKPLKSGQRLAADEQAREEDAEDDEEDDEDIPVSDLEDLDEEDKEDLIPHTRLTINNAAALQAALDRISIPADKSTPFASHQSVVASVATADSIPDVSDDLQRELAFYSQCLEAARHGRDKLLAEGIPFSRPKDYFAEMVKEDAHMEKVKAKLVEEASAKKAAAEARKLRDLKKFGKQVQVAKLQERHKAKRETLDKIKTLKRKRQESGADPSTNEADMFDVGVDHEIAKHSQRGPKGTPAGSKRLKKNEKYGFGGKKRHAKSGDAVSSGDLSGFDAKRMKAAGAKGRGGKGGKAAAARPGKARRKAMGAK
ncbi:eukaryotic rRNA processing protein EBP2 domain-containing protein [Hirsutella rhossiliensis]|uniref:Eukaryotic rRNA processing protein EBP2 domain-containing protein n=1 Tax=Hirsutella rhossiliensis TaxID=111463 RepID=A0A9P8MYS2_9HYPO|nr:eukaryotic rRNA processing protein EBP2 domain-containing protein [Hirsutella rhossiliensis]KAH0964868.1 eukaryotic rRNA processing protein EBP2 domain-containing protein [Hirsutella rhossiliensis]